MAAVRRDTFTYVGLQVTLCDPMWQVTSHSSEVGFSPGRAISAFTFTFLPLTFEVGRCAAVFMVLYFIVDPKSSDNKLTIPVS